MNCKTLELASGTSLQFDHLHKYWLSAVIDLQHFVVSIGEYRGEKDKDAHLLLGKYKIYVCTNNLLEFSQPICQIEYLKLTHKK